MWLRRGHASRLERQQGCRREEIWGSRRSKWGDWTGQGTVRRTQSVRRKNGSLICDCVVPRCLHRHRLLSTQCRQHAACAVTRLHDRRLSIDRCELADERDSSEHQQEGDPSHGVSPESEESSFYQSYQNVVSKWDALCASSYRIADRLEPAPTLDSSHIDRVWTEA